MKKTSFALIVALIFSWVAFQACFAGKYTVPIMMYHQIEDIDHHEANWVSPENFKKHMRFLAQNGYNVISLDAFVTAVRENRKLPHKTVVITFDDGYENNYTDAFAVLKEYGFPATVFMPADKIGIPGRLTLAQLKEMMRYGVSVDSHGLMEKYLPDLTPERQRKEIFESKEVLEKSLGETVKYFAYPIGGFSDGIKTMIKQAGYKAACATNRGYDRFNRDVYELNRIRFSNKDDSDFILWAKLSGYYNLFRKLKKPF